MLWRNFDAGSASATVRITGRWAGKSLVLALSCDRPWVTALDLGALGAGSAATPGPGALLSRRRPLSPARRSLCRRAARLDRLCRHILQAGPKPATTRSPTARAPNCGSAPFSRPPGIWRRSCPIHRTRLRRGAIFWPTRSCLNVWGGSFANIAADLGKLAGYGITNCVALIHDWQRSGYDNALPMHYPANARYGGDAGMSNLVATGARLGIRCALHENYVDYYPNYDFYDTNDIALDSAGNLQHAWYNPGTRIQSFAVKPNAILRLAATQSPEIHRRYNTPADYLDVHSAVPPWFHVDDRAGQTGAGQFSRVWDVHRQLWAYERDTHHGPVFGEGNDHWYWSGCLDGVEAQFGSGWPGNGGFTAPLAVDFDLLKIHPLQFNHGMGYYSRWWPTEAYQSNWAGPVPMVVLDRYRMQEVAYGHAGFLDASVYANVPLAWLEHHLLSPVMARYALARAPGDPLRNSRHSIDATAAAKLDNAGVWNRVRVRSENGLVVTANGSSNLLAAGSWLLPDLDWVAEGTGSPPARRCAMA